MKIVPLFAGIIFLNSLAYADVQEQDKEGKGENSSVTANESSGAFKTVENYPNPF